ncbi:MAG: DUF349 domain-containing protein [Crocinitomicaceae bacterium]|jgi:hypothetical protein|nr:DUF349 domain-containing protein [Crocinitomicaceae bacterium]
MKAEIIAKIIALNNQPSVLNSTDEFNELVNEFYQIQNEEERLFEIEKLDRMAAGEKPENIERPVYAHLEEFKAVSNVFKERKKVELTQIKDQETANYKQKKVYIAALTDLIQNEENIGKALTRFKEIQDGWKEVGPVPRDKRQGLQNEYSHLIDTFRYNIGIYKDIKDHDLNRNLTLKKDLIEKLKGLLNLDKIKEIETQLHSLQDEWNSLGGTHQEEWAKIKDEYWNTVNAVYEKIRKFYEERKADQAKNIELKKELIQKAKEINERELTDHKHWQKASDQLLELQEEWKKAGYGPRDENEVIWQEFRGVCNEFFAKKKVFYGERNDQFSDVKAKKEALIKEAEELKSSTDWKGGTQKILNLQKKWKEIGSAGPKFENQLWKKFRDPIDAFFASKDSHFKDQDSANKENLDKKNAVIEKIKAYEAGGDTQKIIADLKAFSEEFAAIGNVPFEDKDNVYKAYKTALDDKYASLKIGKEEKEKVMFQAKIDSIMTSGNKEKLIDQETSSIRQKIDILNKEILKYETNLGFFSNADSKNPLFKSVNDNIQRNKEEIESLKLRLKLIRQAAK